MTLHVRILLTVTGLLALAVLGTAGALTWSARQSNWRAIGVRIACCAGSRR